MQSCRTSTARALLNLRLLYNHPRASLPRCCRHYHASQLAHTPNLGSWDLESFQAHAFVPEVPYRLPRDGQQLPDACKHWFVHDVDPSVDFLKSHLVPASSELRKEYWTTYEETLVPLELTTRPPGNATDMTFHRSMAPLKLMLDFLAMPQSTLPDPSSREQSVYLAQCPLPTLPSAIRAAVPTPRLVECAGKGDIYNSSLWLGRAPTYTPLHRDPNPNLFIQLAGRKVVRLVPPEIGDAIFKKVQQACHGEVGSKSIRGEEMMVGRQRRLLEAGIWDTGTASVDEAVNDTREALLRFGQEAELAIGEGLFIPKGWWHSVKGIGQGITASVNWWFR